MSTRAASNILSSERGHTLTVADNNWIFSFDIGNACGEDWEAIGMCVDNRLVYLATAWDFPASASAASVKQVEGLERVTEEALR